MIFAYKFEWARQGRSWERRGDDMQIECLEAMEIINAPLCARTRNKAWRTLPRDSRRAIISISRAIPDDGLCHACLAESRFSISRLAGNDGGKFDRYRKAHCNALPRRACACTSHVLLSHVHHGQVNTTTTTMTSAREPLSLWLPLGIFP